jgi:hypothetical protein
VNALLGELRGYLPAERPPQLIQRPAQPFPGNMAVPAWPMQGGSELDWYLIHGGQPQLLKKPPQREGSASAFLAATEIISRLERQRAEQDLIAVKTAYIFRNEDDIVSFLSAHRSVPAVLLAAAPELHQSFGDDVVLHLEVMVEDSEPTALFAIAMWRGRADQAEIDLDDFDERWWLNQPPQHGLTFTYELS